MKYKVDNEEFYRRLSIENPKVHSDTYYENPSTMLDCYCDYGHSWVASARNVLWNHTGCPYCSGQRAIKGKTDLWTTDPDIASMLVNSEDGYKYSRGSGQKVEWRCPDCGNISIHTINYVTKNGFCCNSCSDGFSFPNKFMTNILSELDIKFINEYMINGKKYRYDFYLPEFNLIIEMNGRQHYEQWGKSGRSLENEQLNDKNKMEFAMSNNISNYIVINCMYSNEKYIKNEILKSNLISFINFDSLDWHKCTMNARRSNVKLAISLYKDGITSTVEIAKILHLSKDSVNAWLNDACESGEIEYKKSKGFFKRRKACYINKYW